MKKMMLLMLVTVMANGMDSIDLTHKYQKAVEAIEIDKDYVRGKAILEEVFSKIDNDSPIFKDVYNSYMSIIGMKGDDQLQDAIKFATGRKIEAYCKNVGLVFAKVWHNDETISRLFLIDGKRKMEKDSYAIALDGNWTYQLSTGYRKPTSSTVWINNASSNNYDVQEVRQREDGEDRGKWKASWQGSSFSNSSSTKRNAIEPIPMFMAVDYHAFGSKDLGYRINFEEGSTDQIHGHESTFNHGKIKIISDRKVAKHYDNYRVRVDGKPYSYKDCYQVESTIRFNGIEKKRK